MTEQSNEALALASFLLGYENLIENREQSRQNNIQSANDMQAKYLLNELRKQFDEQNAMLKKILEVVTGENLS